MIKNPLLTVLAVFIALQVQVKSQDFNLLNPGNELYLFSAVDEGANAFRYNPAVLGLNHKFIDTKGLSEYDILVNFGRLGLGLRHANEYVTPQGGYYGSPVNYGITAFTLGLGVGTRKLSAGFTGEYSFMQSEGNLYSYTNNNFKLSFALGVLYRPSDFISASVIYRSNSALTVHTIRTNQYTVGLSARPLRTDRLTLSGDLTLEPVEGSDKFLEGRRFKLGAEVNIIPGLYIGANYTRTEEKFKTQTFNVGFRIESPNTSFRYNHSFNDSYTLETPYIVDPSISYGYEGKQRYIGSAFSLTYTSEKKKSFIPERKKVIEITLSGALQDYNTEDVFFGLLGKGKRSVHEIIADIDDAKNDPSVRGILLKIYPLATGRLDVNAAMEELSASIERFKSKGKKVTAYIAQDAGPAEYYIATYADNIVLPPEAFFFYGLSMNIFNYKQFLQKYGIELQNFYAGKYKLTFQGLLDSTTEEGKEVINRVLDIEYDKMKSRLISARNITMDDYMKTKISQPMTSKDALRLGLVDKLGWYEDAKELSEKNTKVANLVKTINRNEWEANWGEPYQIAIVGVYASITTGESQSPPPVTLPIPLIGGSRSTGSETVVRQLEDAFANPMVRVVILRVDSGGGSALGSAEINAALIRLRAKYKKPFYVSMGGSAASGGYYVSCSADKIFCDDLTVTGSIGVFTSRPNVDSLLEQQKLKVENFKRGENSDIGTFYRKLDKNEIEIIQSLIDFYYDRFIEAISEGRKLSKEEVDQVAQGRVWLGSDAINKKLVDEIGGLYDAIEYAKKKAGISKRYKLVYYAVPGGESVQDVISTSVIKYLEQNVLNISDLDADDQRIEIKY